jgi:uncharacterized protein (TIGR02186 family)
MRFLRTVLGGILLFLLVPPAVLAKPRILAQVSQKQVDIGTNFSGANILLFGTVQGVPKTTKPDVVVVLRGPDVPIVVRHKSRVAGIWVNTRSVTFQTAPGYYALASTGPLDKIADRTWRAVYEIGLDWLHFSPSEGGDSSAQKLADFRDGFVAMRQKHGLFSERPGAVELVDNTLFLVRLDLPTRVPVGTYQADVFLFLNGKFADKTALTLQVEKSGAERAIYDAAHTSPFSYGLFAVLVALIAGWAASVFLRR